MAITISFVICTIIFVYNRNSINIHMKLEKYSNNEYSKVNNAIFLNNISNESLIENKIYKNEYTKESIWKIEIPKINLTAEIAEGTTEEILNQYVGHFTETQKQNGNIGLAAHNRGYKVNYFNRIKELEIDDEIIYTYNNVSKRYKVISKSIIKDTDWNFLENTKDNRITLITCVENKPEYRRCIQGIEVLE